MVVVFPALWESDANQDGFLKWEATLAAQSRRIQSDTAQLNRLRRVGRADFAIDSLRLGLLPGILEGGHDRPIGFLETKRSTGWVFFDAVFLQGRSFVFPVKTLVLTVDTIEQMLNDPSPKGEGVIEVWLGEDGDMGGDYRLYLQVERIP